MKLGRAALALSISALALTSCRGCDDTITRLAPIIAIGDPFNPEFSVCTKGLNEDSKDLFRECAFDFGDVDIGRARVFSFTIRNPSPVDLQVLGVAMSEDSDTAYEIDGEVPKNVQAGVGGTGGLGVVVSVKFQPVVEGPVAGQIVIKSDGENLTAGEDVVINFVANGVARCKPKIAVLPAACNFGDVGVGATAFCDLSINNDGECELLVTDIAFSDDTPFPAVFGPQGAFEVPQTIPGGTGISMRLYARPADTTLTTGTLILSSLDPLNPEVEVPLSVQGADAPTCVARVGRVNSTVIAPGDATPAVEPLDDVEFSSDQSQSARTGGTIVGQAWTIIDAPPESSASLANATGETTRLRFSSAAGNVNGVDVAGTFTIGLVVTDDLGAVSTQCSVTINSVPRAGLHVQLTWDRPDNDIDLHLARNGPTWCGDEDCYYGNCNPSSFGGSPNWGGGNKNPQLDIDDLEGFGPENINIEAPGDGRYTVGVGMYSHDSDANVTVKIFVGGQLEFEGFQLMSRGDNWLPARVEIVSGVSTVVTLNDTGDQAGSCWGGI